jgi:hypothetical protein
LAVFDLKAKKQNVKLDTVIVELSTTTNVKAVRLYDGNTLLNEKSASATTTFNGNMEISIAKDSTKTLTVKALIEKGTNGKDYKVTLVSVSGTDANDNPVNTTGFPVTGNTQHVYTVAPELALDPQQPESTASGTSATFKIRFKATAKGGNVWISKSGSDLNVEIVDDNGTTTTATTSVTILPYGSPSGIADENDYAYKIAKDSTATFEVTILATGLSSGKQYFARIKTVKFNTDGSSTFKELSGKLLKDLKTGYVAIR